ncbi:MAG TPA: thrombospondin type 3 repeat-containing protein [Pyrinomonadaceae bacterium]
MSRPLGRVLPSLSLLTLFFVLTMTPGALTPSEAQRRRPAPPPPQRTTDAQQLADRAQAAGIRRLRAVSAVRPTLKLERGAVRFAALDVRVPASVGANADARASWFLGEHRDLLRVKNPAVDFQLTRRSPDGKFVFFRRRHLGIPVFPGGIGVHLQGTRVKGLAGNYVADEIETVSVPRLTAEQAEQAARGFDRRARGVLGDTSLRYINLGLLDIGDHSTHLAWRVNLTSNKTMYIDAHTGARLYTSSRVMNELDLELDTLLNEGPRDDGACGGGVRWFEEGGVLPTPTPRPDEDGYTAFYSIWAVYDYFYDNFGRDAHDGDGEDVEVYVHVGKNWRGAHYLSQCDLMEFGDEMPVADIMAHEFTHAVDDNTAELEYANQSGALDESFADIFGHFVDNEDWTIREDTPFGAMRSLSDPTDFDDPDRYNSNLRHAYTDNPDKELNDYGGVHTNSGINNKAAYLIIHGETFNGRTIRGIGQRKAQQLFYAVLTQYLWDSARMSDAAEGAGFIAWMWSLGGVHGFTQNDVCQVRNAYAAVELGQGDSNCDGVPDSAPPDFDGDTADDGSDNCPEDSNTGQADWDGDGRGNECDDDDDGDTVPDLTDNCPGRPNPGQQNSYGDADGDACDHSDSDGLFDFADNCPLKENLDQKDLDGDGVGDACDTDMDGDNIPDTSDNCPLKPNLHQNDGDNDRIGDACDLCPNMSSRDNGDPDGDLVGNPCDLDDDNDGLLDGADNCPLNHNPEQSDIDGDGVGFACDEDERKRVFESLKENNVLTARAPLFLPVPVCPQCGKLIPNNHEEVIIVEAPAGFDVRVVDSEGRSVTDGVRGASRHVLRFQPPPHGSSALPARAFGSQALGGASVLRGGAAAQRRLPLDKPAPDELRYYLVVTPTPRADLSRGYRVSFQLNRGVRAPRPRPTPRPVRPTPQPVRPTPQPVRPTPRPPR